MIDYELLVPLLFTGIALAGAWSDVRKRIIPNFLSAFFAVSGLVATWLSGGAAAAGSSLVHLLVALVIGMVLYALSMWGGGDAKFYAASSAWFTLSELPRLVMTITFAGLLLLIVWFVGRRVVRRSEVRSRRGELPYGVAIAAGGIALMATQAL